MWVLRMRNMLRGILNAASDGPDKNYPLQTVRDRHYHMGRAGERTCLDFVEVKYRKGRQTGLPEEALSVLKKNTIIRVAEFYYSRYRIRNGTLC